jgi:putative FmdB family regulatory protein
MPLYDYCCPQGHLFEQMATIADRERQDCLACGHVGEKIPARISLAGRADPGPAMEQMPQTWRGTHAGIPSTSASCAASGAPGRNSRTDIRNCAAISAPSWPTRVGITPNRYYEEDGGE